MKESALCFLLWVTALAPPAGAAISEPVRTDGGFVTGVPGMNPSVTVFKGLPFAAPPVGGVRWRAPKPPAGWEGVRDFL